ncbi:MAG: CHAD domain-containing protein [Phycisphaerae bacterium]
MPYRVKAHEPPAQAVKRMAIEQVGKAIGELRNPDMDAHAAVHQVRKRCKKIRALLRLVRPTMEGIYSEENAWYRDVARKLSDLRDAEAMIETFDDLREIFQELLDEEAFGQVRQGLVARRDRMADGEADLEALRPELAIHLDNARPRIETWPIPDGGFDVFAGIEKVYDRGRTAMSEAYRKPGEEAFHEWRKRVKYLRYQVRMLRGIWPAILRPLRGQLKTLSDYLGDEHDLSVFGETLRKEGKELTEDRTLEALLALVEQRKDELRARARPLGTRIYAEKAGRFTKRMATYWDAWQQQLASRPILAHQQVSA